NPYERNHWGYMTSAFFAPESYYSENTRNIKWNSWSGADAKAVYDFKDMVKAFHKEGIAVIMDVVYNHLSEYEFGNLKEIDKEYYFRLNEQGDFIAESGCGNDLRTEAPMLRKLIIESILYWMKEYHIDGFRFDLGKLIDWETIETIIYEAKKINPDVVFVCEPWGGGYDPAGFSLRGWGAWNDQIRNGIKGENPFNGLGWIFGHWYGNNNPQRIKSYVNGTLVTDTFGLFQKPHHSVNYLESHDGYTFGDFIRLATKSVARDEIIKDVDSFVKLSPLQLKLNKLGALFLFTSRGITMIHSGQEFARTKVIPYDLDVPDSHKGMIDHNSYEKDNETNYINYKYAEINKDLYNYYKGLIELRKKYSAFRRAEYNDVKFHEVKKNPFAICYELKYKDEHFFIAMNANPEVAQQFQLPKGEWEVLVDPSKAGTTPIKIVKNKIEVEPTSGFVLKRK
ncbi:MAG: alpha-amylase family glycosyl hydrolase, partial [Ignavibacterium sp.]